MSEADCFSWEHLFGFIGGTSSGPFTAAPLGWDEPLLCFIWLMVPLKLLCTPRLWECQLILTQLPLLCCYGLPWPLRLGPLLGTRLLSSQLQAIHACLCVWFPWHGVESHHHLFLFCRAGTYCVVRHVPQSTQKSSFPFLDPLILDRIPQGD